MKLTEEKIREIFRDEIQHVLEDAKGNNGAGLTEQRVKEIIAEEMLDYGTIEKCGPSKNYPIDHCHFRSPIRSSRQLKKENDELMREHLEKNSITATKTN